MFQSFTDNISACKIACPWTYSFLLATGKHYDFVVESPLFALSLSSFCFRMTRLLSDFNGTHFLCESSRRSKVIIIFLQTAGKIQSADGAAEGHENRKKSHLNNHQYNYNHWIFQSDCLASVRFPFYVPGVHVQKIMQIFPSSKLSVSPKVFPASLAKINCFSRIWVIKTRII